MSQIDKRPRLHGTRCGMETLKSQRFSKTRKKGLVSICFTESSNFSWKFFFLVAEILWGDYFDDYISIP